MDNYLSEKIKIISLIMILMVLYIHSDFHDYPHEIQGMIWNHYLQDFISGMLGRCAVPMFFAISGYLFFVKLNCIENVFHKMYKRVKTILVPFVIAALIYPFCFYILAFFQGASLYINTDIVGILYGKNIFELIYSIFIDNGAGQPLAFHLWFLRDLICIICLSPLIYFIKKNIANGCLSILIFLFAIIFQNIGLLTSIFWFLFGSEYLLSCGKINKILPFVIFIVLSFYELLYPHTIWLYVKIPVILLGVISIWNLYDLVIGPRFKLESYKWLNVACQFTFFVYLYHEPFLNIIRKVIVLLLGRYPFSFAMSYLLSPWIFIILCIYIGIQIRRLMPNLYNILVGGR